MNRVRSSSTGYTIVETMIFLAVSGALFLSAMLLVGGQQRKTEFATSVREIDSKLQSVIGNVSSGYYNNIGLTKCDADPITGVITVTGSGGSVGSNGDCTFVGQFIDISPAGDSFTITSYAGLRIDPVTSKNVTDLNGANPSPITDTTETFSLLNGVRAHLKWAAIDDIKRLAITTSFNQYNGSGSLASGSTSSEFHVYSDVGAFDPLKEKVPIPSGGIEICLDDGQQTGIIKLNTGNTRVSFGRSPCL